MNATASSPILAALEFQLAEQLRTGLDGLLQGSTDLAAFYQESLDAALLAGHTAGVIGLGGLLTLTRRPQADGLPLLNDWLQEQLCAVEASHAPASFADTGSEGLVLPADVQRRAGDLTRTLAAVPGNIYRLATDWRDGRSAAATAVVPGLRPPDDRMSVAADDVPDLAARYWIVQPEAVDALRRAVLQGQLTDRRVFHQVAAIAEALADLGMPHDRPDLACVQQAIGLGGVAQVVAAAQYAGTHDRPTEVNEVLAWLRDHYPELVGTARFAGEVQALLFPTDLWPDAGEIRDWCRDHGYTHGEIDTTDGYHRVRQLGQDKCTGGTRTIAFGSVKAVVRLGRADTAAAIATFEAGDKTEDKEEVKAGDYGDGEPHWTTFSPDHHVLIHGRGGNATIESGPMKGVFFEDAKKMFQHGLSPLDIGKAHDYHIPSKHLLTHLAKGGKLDELLPKYEKLRGAKTAVGNVLAASGQLVRGLGRAFKQLLPWKEGPPYGTKDILQGLSKLARGLVPAAAGGVRLGLHAVEKSLMRGMSDWNIGKGVAHKLAALAMGTVMGATGTGRRLKHGMIGQGVLDFMLRRCGSAGRALAKGMAKTRRDVDKGLDDKFGKPGARVIRAITQQLMGPLPGLVAGTLLGGPFGAAAGLLATRPIRAVLNQVPMLRTYLAKLVGAVTPVKAATATAAGVAVAGKAVGKAAVKVGKAAGKAAVKVGKTAKATASKVKAAHARRKEAKAARRAARESAEMAAGRVATILLDGGDTVLLAADAQDSWTPQKLADGVCGYLSDLLNGIMAEADRNPSMKAKPVPLTDEDNAALEKMLDGAGHADFVAGVPLLDDRQLCHWDPPIPVGPLACFRDMLVRESVAGALLRNIGLDGGGVATFLSESGGAAAPPSGWAVLDGWPVLFDSDGRVTGGAAGFLDQLADGDRPDGFRVTEAEEPVLPPELDPLNTDQMASAGFTRQADPGDFDVHIGSKGRRKGMAGLKHGTGWIIWEDDPRYARIMEARGQKAEAPALQEVSGKHDGGGAVTTRPPATVPPPSVAPAANQRDTYDADFAGMLRKYGGDKAVRYAAAHIIQERDLHDRTFPHGVDEDWVKRKCAEVIRNSGDNKAQAVARLVSLTRDLLAKRMPADAEPVKPQALTLADRKRRVAVANALPPGQRGGPGSPFRNVLWDTYERARQALGVGDTGLAERVPLNVLHLMASHQNAVPHRPEEFRDEMLGALRDNKHGGPDGTVTLEPYTHRELQTLRAKKPPLITEGEAAALPVVNGQTMGYVRWNRPGWKHEFAADEVSSAELLRLERLRAEFADWPRRSRAFFASCRPGLLAARGHLERTGNRAALRLLEDLALFFADRLAGARAAVAADLGPACADAVVYLALSGVEPGRDAVTLPACWADLPPTTSQLLLRTPLLALAGSVTAFSTDGWPDLLSGQPAETVARLASGVRAETYADYLCQLEATWPRLLACLGTAAWAGDTDGVAAFADDLPLAVTVAPPPPAPAPPAWDLYQAQDALRVWPPASDLVPGRDPLSFALAPPPQPPDGVAAGVPEEEAAYALAGQAWLGAVSANPWLAEADRRWRSSLVRTTRDLYGTRTRRTTGPLAREAFLSYVTAWLNASQAEDPETQSGLMVARGLLLRFAAGDDAALPALLDAAPALLSPAASLLTTADGRPVLAGRWGADVVATNGMPAAGRDPDGNVRIVRQATVPPAVLEDFAYTPERRRLHDGLLAGLLNPAAQVDPGGVPAAAVLACQLDAWTPALGACLHALGAAVLARTAATTTLACATGAARMFPEFSGWNTCHLGGEAADMVYGELLPGALAARHHLVLVQPAVRPDDLRRLGNGLSRLGYDVVTVQVKLDPLERAWLMADGFLADPFGVRGSAAPAGTFVPWRWLSQSWDVAEGCCSQVWSLSRRDVASLPVAAMAVRVQPAVMPGEPQSQWLVPSV